MSLADDLQSITMHQTRDYQEDASTSVDAANSVLQSNPVVETDNVKEKKKINPLIFLISGGVILIVIGFFVINNYYTKYQKEKEMEEQLAAYEEPPPPFKYSAEEREEFRVWGFTADDIEKFEAEERNPAEIIQDVKDKQDKAIAELFEPYKDSESEEFKELKKNTWVGGEDIPEEVLSMPYSEYFGTYNCDYRKIPAKGTQLYVKIYIFELKQAAFFTVTPERYAQLKETGNIVVYVTFNKYDDGRIIITKLEEKNIAGD